MRPDYLIRRFPGDVTVGGRGADAHGYELLAVRGLPGGPHFVTVRGDGSVMRGRSQRPDVLEAERLAAAYLRGEGEPVEEPTHAEG